MVHRPRQGPQAGTGRGSPETDDSLRWEEFFGASVDIASSLLDMYDALVAQDKATEQRHCTAPTTTTTQEGQPRPEEPHKVTDVVQQGSALPSGTYVRGRPLSASSLSSSSSSSSSSLPRNGMYDVKKSYLASIESLDDDLSEDSTKGGVTPQHRHHHYHHLLHLLPTPPVGHPSTSSCPSPATPTSQQSSVTTPPGQSRNTPLSHLDRVIAEICDTERTYVSDLKEMIEGYLNNIPVSGGVGSKISKNDLSDLFGNIEDIYSFNSLFLSDLEQCGLDPVAVARCFVQHSNGFTVYTQYCTNYPRTVAILTELMGSSETAEIFKERQTALHHSLPLGSYLLKPVQRILKYHLLLQNIVKYSDKESGGYPDIKNALSVMTGIAYHINDMKRKHEHAVRVQEIQSLLYGWEGQDLTTYGELVAEGTFRMVGAKALRHIFLFDKMLVIAKKKEEAILSYKTHIMCSNLMLIESIQGEPLCFHVIPFDNPRLQYTFQARSLEQKREWCLQLKRVILENYNAVIPLHARQLVMELGQSRPEDSASMDKVSTRRLLSAPEYLERRKQERERRLSEINLHRAFRLKKGAKKLSARRTRSCTQETTSNDINPAENAKEESDYRRGSIDSQSTTGTSNSSTSQACNQKKSVPVTGKTNKLAMLGTSPDDTPSKVREKRGRAPWRAWNSLPEETTDTENEESEQMDVRRLLQYRPQGRIAKQHLNIRTDDPAGDYVTFYFAQAHAFRNVGLNEHSNRQSIAYADQDCDSEASGAFDSSVNGSEDQETGRTNYDNLTNMWLDSGTQKASEDVSSAPPPLPPRSSSGSFSWRHNPAVRRVQSFTGLARAKVASLHQTLSFRQQNSSDTEKPQRPTTLNLKSSILPSQSTDNMSPTAPAIWLKKQEEHLADGYNKCGSLPRSFQLGQDDDYVSDSSTIASSEGGKPRRRCVGYGEQRPITIASDKPNQVDFMDDMERYIEDVPNKCHSYRFPVSHEQFDDTTGCTNSPAVSIENVSAIHPEHRIYHHSASKYNAFRNVLSNVSSKLAHLKASVSPNSMDLTDSCSNLSGDSDYHNKADLERSRSRLSVRSDREPSPKSSKLIASIAKAYSAMIRQRLKRDSQEKTQENCSTPASSRKSIPPYRPNSSAIGARMAQPLESEYCCPKTLMLDKKRTSSLRPDSVLSESSNTTSSSDGDKNSCCTLCIPNNVNPALQLDLNDSPSDTSDASADSYYERTFEEIENALTEEIFRDSAIYSDPEYVDASPVQSPLIFKLNMTCSENKTLPSNDVVNEDKHNATDIICSHKIKGKLIDKLRTLEENSKFQKDDSNGLPGVEGLKSIRERRLELERWRAGNSDGLPQSSLEVQVPCSEELLESSTPRMRGWVKQIVDKLEAENQE